MLIDKLSKSYSCLVREKDWLILLIRLFIVFNITYFLTSSFVSNRLNNKAVDMFQPSDVKLYESNSLYLLKDVEENFEKMENTYNKEATEFISRYELIEARYYLHLAYEQMFERLENRYDMNKSNNFEEYKRTMANLLNEYKTALSLYQEHYHLLEDINGDDIREVNEDFIKKLNESKDSLQTKEKELLGVNLSAF